MTSQRPHFLTPSRWVIGFNIPILEGYKPSDHSTGEAGSKLLTQIKGSLREPRVQGSHQLIILPQHPADSISGSVRHGGMLVKEHRLSSQASRLNPGITSSCWLHKLCPIYNSQLQRKERIFFLKLLVEISKRSLRGFAWVLCHP